MRSAESKVNVIGAAINNEFVRAALMPPARTNCRAFYIVVDELAKSLSPDHLKLVRETRKYRCFFCGASQEPAALRAYDEELYLSVMTNCRAKVIFGGVTTAELEPLVRDAIAPVADADIVKFDVERTYFEPRESTRLTHSHTEGENEMVSETDSEGTVDSWGAAKMNSWSRARNVSDSGSVAVTTPLDDGSGLLMETGYGSETIGAGSMSGGARGRGGVTVTSRGGDNIRSHSLTRAFGRNSADTVSEVPFHELLERHELSSRQFRTLDEQVQTMTNRVHSLPQQHCLVTETGSRPYLIKVWDMRDAPVSAEAVSLFREAVMRGPCYSTPDEVDAEIEARGRALLEEFKPTIKLRGRASRESRGPTRRKVTGSKAPVNGSRRIEATAPVTDPLAMLEREQAILVCSDDDSLRQFLGKLSALTPTARRPFLDRMAIESGRPISYFNRLLRGSRNGG